MNNNDITIKRCSIVTYTTMYNYPNRCYFLDENETDLFIKHKPSEMILIEKKEAGWNNTEDVHVEFSRDDIKYISDTAYEECKFLSDNVNELMFEVNKCQRILEYEYTHIDEIQEFENKRNDCINKLEKEIKKLNMTYNNQQEINDKQHEINKLKAKYDIEYECLIKNQEKEIENIAIQKYA